MRRILALVTGGLAMSAIALAPAATATPVCAGASTQGTVTGTHAVGPFCAPYPYAVACEFVSAGVDPDGELFLTGCYPLP